MGYHVDDSKLVIFTAPNDFPIGTIMLCVQLVGKVSFSRLLFIKCRNLFPTASNTTFNILTGLLGFHLFLYFTRANAEKCTVNLNKIIRSGHIFVSNYTRTKQDGQKTFSNTIMESKPLTKNYFTLSCKELPCHIYQFIIKNRYENTYNKC